MAKLITMKEKENGQYVNLYPQTDWSQVNGADAQITAVTNSTDVKVANLQGQINQKQDASTAITTSNIYSYYRLTTGHYTGNGEQEMKITLSFTPKAVYVALQSGNMGSWIPEGSGRGVAYTYGGLAVYGSTANTWKDQPSSVTVGSKVVEIVPEGFKVFYVGETSNFMVTSSNASGTTYNFLALG